MLSLFITLPIRTKTLERHAIPSHNFFCQIAIPSLDLKRDQIQGNELHVWFPNSRERIIQFDITNYFYVYFNPRDFHTLSLVFRIATNECQTNG